MGWGVDFVWGEHFSEVGVRRMKMAGYAGMSGLEKSGRKVAFCDWNARLCEQKTWYRCSRNFVPKPSTGDLTFVFPATLRRIFMSHNVDLKTCRPQVQGCLSFQTLLHLHVPTSFVSYVCACVCAHIHACKHKPVNVNDLRACFLHARL